MNQFHEDGEHEKISSSTWKQEQQQQQQQQKQHQQQQQQQLMSGSHVRRATGRLGFTAAGTNPKVAVNQWLCRLLSQQGHGQKQERIKTAVQNSSGIQRSDTTHAAKWALALDSEALTTLRTLTDDSSSGVTPATFVLPNPDPVVCEAARAAGVCFALPVTSHTLLLELAAGLNKEETEVAAVATAAAIARSTTPPDGKISISSRCIYDELVAAGWPGYFHFIWLDYCGTLDSKAGKLRRLDIVYCCNSLASLVIKKSEKKEVKPTAWSNTPASSLLAPVGAVFAVTVSERGGSQPYLHAAVDDLIEYVQQQQQDRQTREKNMLMEQYSRDEKITNMVLQSAGVACYHHMNQRTDRTPRYLCTAAWLTSDMNCENFNRTCYSPDAPRLEFWSQWPLYNHVNSNPLPLLCATRACTERFMFCIKHIFMANKNKKSAAEEREQIIMILDTKLAPATRAVLPLLIAARKIEDELNHSNQTMTTDDNSVTHATISSTPTTDFSIMSGVEKLDDLRPAKISTESAMNELVSQVKQEEREVNVMVHWSEVAGLHHLVARVRERLGHRQKQVFDQVAESGSTIDFDNHARVVACWLDYERHGTFTCEELQQCSRQQGVPTKDRARWQDLDRLFAAGVLSAQREKPSQVLAINLRVTDGKEVWEGIYMDWLLQGLQEVADRHCNNSSSSSSSLLSSPGLVSAAHILLLSVASYKAPPAMRISLIVEVGGEKKEVEGSYSRSRKELLSWNPIPRPYSSWTCSTRWSLDRLPKLPTSNAWKYEPIAPHAALLIKRFDLTCVTLEEPGFHWVLPALLSKQPLHLKQCTEQKNANDSNSSSKKSRNACFHAQCTIWEKDIIQHRDVEQRLCRCYNDEDEKKLVTRIEPMSLMTSFRCRGYDHNTPVDTGENCDFVINSGGEGLFLLSGVGAVAFRHRWFPIVEQWFQNKTTQIANSHDDDAHDGHWLLLTVLVAENVVATTDELLKDLRQLFDRQKQAHKEDSDAILPNSSSRETNTADGQNEADVHYQEFSFSRCSITYRYWCFRYFVRSPRGLAQADHLGGGAQSDATSSSTDCTRAKPWPSFRPFASTKGE